MFPQQLCLSNETHGVAALKTAIFAVRIDWFKNINTYHNYTLYLPILRTSVSHVYFALKLVFPVQ